LLSFNLLIGDELVSYLEYLIPEEKILYFLPKIRTNVICEFFVPVIRPTNKLVNLLPAAKTPYPVSLSASLVVPIIPNC
jgi:hypothetical protein